MAARCIDALNALRAEVSVEVADTKHAILEAQRLRHIVFCKERDILAANGTIDEDEFDCRSHHIVLRRRSSGELIGTVRLVVPPLTPSKVVFPIQRVASAEVFDGIPVQTTAEISRFGLSRERRSSSRLSDPIMRLALMQGVLQVSQEIGLTHWCAAMEPSLLRLLRSVGIHFEERGPPVEYRGIRQPSVGCISSILERGRHEQPELWAFVTGADRAAWPQRAGLAA